MVRIKAYGPVGIVIDSNNAGVIDGEYLKSYDPEAHDGLGDATFTQDKGKALVFVDNREAIAFVMKVPKARPLRADGRPNRPILVFSLEIEQVK